MKAPVPSEEIYGKSTRGT